MVAVIDPGFKDGLVTSLSGVGGSVWTGAYNGWNSFAMTVGSSGLYFLVFSIVTVLFGWQLLGRMLSVAKTKLARTPSTPAPVIIRQNQLSGASELAYSNPTPEKTIEETKAEA